MSTSAKTLPADPFSAETVPGRILLAGFVYLDIRIRRPKQMPGDGEEHFTEPFRILPGGIFHTAKILKDLGANPCICYPKGNGVSSKWVSERLVQLGIDEHAFPSSSENPAVSLVLESPEDRSIISHADFDALQIEDTRSVAGLFEDSSWMYVAGLKEAKQLDGFIRAFRSQPGRRVCVGGSWAPQELNELKTATLKTHPWDLLILNQKEASEVGGTPESCINRLGSIFPEIIVTLGKDGAMGMASGEIHTQKAEPLPNTSSLRTTGAGDAFCAGVLAGKLRGISTHMNELLTLGVRTAGAYLAQSRGRSHS